METSLKVTINSTEWTLPSRPLKDKTSKVHTYLLRKVHGTSLERN